MRLRQPNGFCSSTTWLVVDGAAVDRTAIELRGAIGWGRPLASADDIGREGTTLLASLPTSQANSVVGILAC